MPEEKADNADSKTEKTETQEEAPKEDTIKEVKNILEGITDAMKKAQDNFEEKVVESFTELPACNEIIYEWPYTFINTEGKGKSFIFRFHAIPRKEFNRLDELMPYPEPDKRPAVDQYTKEPVIDQDGKIRMIEMTDDPNYIKQRDKVNVKRSITLIEVSLGFQVPGDTIEKKIQWFDDQNTTLFKSMCNIVYGRLLGGGLVNFT